MDNPNETSAAMRDPDDAEAAGQASADADGEAAPARTSRPRSPWRSFLSLQTLVGALAVPSLTFFVWLSSASDALIVEPISAPETLSKNGITGMALANKLMDEMRRISAVRPDQREAVGARRSSPTERFLAERSPLIRYPVRRALSAQAVTLQMPDAGVYSKVLQALGTAFGRTNIMVTGELEILPRVSAGQKDACGEGGEPRVALTVRVTDQPARRFGGCLVELNGLLADAAEYVYEVTEPYVLAAYRCVRPRASCLEVLDNILARGRPGERAAAYTLLGHIRTQERRFPEAEELFALATALDAGASWLGWPSWVPWGRGDAVDGTRLRAAHAEAYVNWGILLGLQGQPDAAAEKFGHPFCKQHGEAYIWWAALLLDRHAFEQAYAKAQEGVRLSPDSDMAHFFIGRAALELKRPGEAMARLGRAIELNGNHALAHFWLGETLRAGGKPERAMDKLRRADELLGGRFAAANNSLGQTLVAVGQPREAAQMFHRAIQNAPAYPEPYYHLGLLYRQVDQKPAARAYLAAFLALANAAREAGSDDKLASARRVLAELEVVPSPPPAGKV